MTRYDVKKVAQGDDVIRKLCKTLGREGKNGRKAVYQRWKYFMRTYGLKTTGHKPFSLLEDLLVIDNIVDRLGDQKLVDLLLSSRDQVVKEHFSQRSSVSVRDRWSTILKPMLLQHFAGTLNLGVERKLANHILETYTDALEIDWQEVAGTLEFPGHTVHSLKKIYIGKLTWNASQKLGVGSKEVSLQDVADYANRVMLI